MYWKKNIVFPLILFFGILGLYIHNLSPSVYGGDVGDLVTAAVVGGVAHPPGYPLFTFLGFILTQISTNPTPAYVVGLVSAFSGALSVLIMFLLIRHITQHNLIALISALILAFFYPFWLYSEVAEVFSLNSFFVLSLLYVALLLREKKKPYLLYILSYLLGLSITNHHTIIFIFPAILILIVPAIRSVLSIKSFLISLLLCLLGFSVYIYVPIASSFNPIINWDKVKDIDSFLHLFLRKDYGTFRAASVLPYAGPMERLIILKTFILYQVFQLTIPVIALAGLGMVSLIKKRRSLFASLAITYIISGPFFVVYAAFPLYRAFLVGIYERFFIFSSIIIIIAFAIGLHVIYTFFNLYLKKYSSLLIGVFFIIPGMLFLFNFPKTNLSNVWVGDYLASDLLSPLPKNAALLVSGDTIVFNSWYARYALQQRPDVQIINVALGDSFIKEKVREYRKKNPQVQDDNIMVETIRELSKSRPVFSYISMQSLEGKKIKWIPEGLVYRLLPESEAAPSLSQYTAHAEKVWKNSHYEAIVASESISNRNLSITEIPGIYSDGLLATGNFMMAEYKDTKKALFYYDKAVKIDPNNGKAYLIYGNHYIANEKNCKKAEENLRKSIELNPFVSLAYFLLYTSYKTCSNNVPLADNVVKDYGIRFQRDFHKDIAFMVSKNQQKKND